MDQYQLGLTLGGLREEVRQRGDRQIYVAELTLREVRAMRREADQRSNERAVDKASIPRWDPFVKEVLRWLTPAAVLLATGSLERALGFLK